MILSAEDLFSDDQDLAQTAAAYDSTNIIKLPANSAHGNPLRILVQVTETFTSAGAATLAIDLETDDNEAMASATDLVSIAAIGKATLVAGYKFYINFVPRGDEGFLRLEYTIGTATTTAGKITAGIIFDDQTSKSTFPSGSDPG